MQTIHARASYIAGGEGGNAIALRRSNEMLHQLCGHALRVLAGSTDPDGDASFMAMVLDAYGQAPDQLWTWLRDAQTRAAAISDARG